MKHHVAIIATALICIGVYGLQGQTIISTGGNSVQTAAFSVTQTIGELVIPTFDGNIHVTQGFNQPLGWLVDNVEAPVDFVLQIFPNPTSDIVRLKGDFSAGMIWEIRNLNGQLVLQGKLVSSPYSLNLSALASGIYLLLVGDESHGFHTMKLEKIR